MALSLRFHSPYGTESTQDALNGVLGAIRSAHQTLDLCLGELGLESVVAEAAQARKRGVQVRWILSAQACENAERLLAQQGFKKWADWRHTGAQAPTLNQNWWVIDGSRVFLGTLHLTPAGAFLDDNLHIVVENEDLAQGFTQVFEQFWNELGANNGSQGNWPFAVPAIENLSVGPDQHVSAYFTPYDGRVTLERLIEVIGQAEESIHFAFPSLAEPRLMDALEERARAGVEVTGVLDGPSAMLGHFRHAPKLKSAILAGKIRAVRAFAQNGQGFWDRMSLQTVTIDSRWTAVASGKLHESATPVVAEAVLVMDSASVARQCAHWVDVLLNLARRGGHQVEECRTWKEFQNASGERPTVWTKPAPSPAKLAKVRLLADAKKAREEKARAIEAARAAAEVRRPEPRTQAALSRKPAHKKTAAKKPAKKTVTRKTSGKKRAPAKKASAKKSMAKKGSPKRKAA